MDDDQPDMGNLKKAGRPKGVKNKSNYMTREYIMKLGDPVKFLSDVMHGNVPAEGNHGMQAMVPTDEMRQDAAKTLLKKLIPDLKASEIKVADKDIPKLTIITTEKELEEDKED